MPGPNPDDLANRRLGRAVLFILQQAPVVNDPIVRADVGALLRAGQVMDFASRLQGHARTVTPELALQYARHSGLGQRDLLHEALPVLKQADVVDYAVTPDGELQYVEELVGVTGSVIEQTFRVLHALNPTDAELAVLHSVEIAAWAPLTESQHLEQVTHRGLDDESAERGLTLARAMGINNRIWSRDLNEYVVFNPYVWGTRQVEIATFLRDLPPNERDVLLGIFDKAAGRPGITLDQMGVTTPLLNTARKVGLIQAATVKSSSGGTKTYAFSPLLQAEDDQLNTTEALHLRKLFVAHILFGHEHAEPGLGKIQNPLVLVRSLLNRGRVGPATNIGTDYHLLEAAGVVRVEPVEGTDRAILHLIKREIVEGGFGWLESSLGGFAPAGSPTPNLQQVPGSFLSPERDRATVPDEAASNEIAAAAVMKLREEAKRAARWDSPFS